MADKRKKKAPKDRDEEDYEEGDGRKISSIANRERRAQAFDKYKQMKKKEKRSKKLKRRREVELLGDAAPPAKRPRTLEDKREHDVTMVDPNDQEVKEDQTNDEFAEYFKTTIPPKILITTNYQDSKEKERVGKFAGKFIEDLVRIIPNSVFRKRKNFTLKQIIETCKENNFSDIIVVNIDRLKPNALILSHLPDGPTAYFKLTSVLLRSQVHNVAGVSEHYPEVILNNFNTRLGHTVGRMFGVLVPQKPEFEGRRVITWHNQRDFIFFRHHRYVFDSDKEARLQEIGPRFTLKLKALQHGTINNTHGEFEWVRKPELLKKRTRFFI